MPEESFPKTISVGKILPHIKGADTEPLFGWSANLNAEEPFRMSETQTADSQEPDGMPPNLEEEIFWAFYDQAGWFTSPGANSGYPPGFHRRRYGFRNRQVGLVRRQRLAFKRNKHIYPRPSDPYDPTKARALFLKAKDAA